MDPGCPTTHNHATSRHTRLPLLSPFIGAKCAIIVVELYLILGAEQLVEGDKLLTANRGSEE